MLISPPELCWAPIIGLSRLMKAGISVRDRNVPKGASERRGPHANLRKSRGGGLRSPSEEEGV